MNILQNLEAGGGREGVFTITAKDSFNGEKVLNRNKIKPGGDLPFLT